PFLIVQIAPHKDMKPELRDAQRMVVAHVPNTALIVTTDCGDAMDIHPTNKKPVGERLALAAHAFAYHGKEEYQGPMYSAYKIKADKLSLTFKHIGKGLVSLPQEEKLKGFELAGADGVYYPAMASIEDTTIVLSSDRVKKPKQARYGWANVPDVNFYNKDGLPASPFITEDVNEKN